AEGPPVAQPEDVEIAGEEERPGAAGEGQLAGGGERGILDDPDRDLVQLELHLELLRLEAAPAHVAAAAELAVVGLPGEVAPEDARLAEVELALQPAQLERLSADAEAGVDQGGGADDLRIRRLAAGVAQQLEPPRGAIHALDERLQQPEVDRAGHRDLHRVLFQEARGAELRLRALQPQAIAAHPPGAEAQIP